MRVWGIFTFLCACLLVASTAFAQEGEGGAESDQGRDDQARALFQAGRVAFENGRYREAMRYFGDAYELSHRAGILYNIGHAAQLHGDNEAALEAYEQYLAESPDADNRVAVEARVVRLRELTGRDETSGEDPPEPEGGEPEGSESGAAASGTGDPSADGEGESNAIVPAEPEDEEADDASGGGTPIGAWLLMGGGVAAAGVGVAMLAVAGGAASTVSDAPAGTAWVDVESDYDSAGTFSVVGSVLIGVGLAAAVGGLVWVIAGGGDEETQVAVSPMGVLLRGTL